MNYYLIFLKNDNKIFVQADYFYSVGSPDAVLFENKNKNSTELVAYFRAEELIGCTKINEEELDFWKENDDHGERCGSQN